MTKNTQTATAAIGEEVGRKLSVKELGWDKPTILETVLSARDQQHPLARFVGVAVGTKEYKIKEGEKAGELGFGLLGTFEGTNIKTGESLLGSVLYLPGYIQDQIVAALHMGQEGDAVQIGFDIYAEYNADAVTSYVFTGRNLIPVVNPALEAAKASVAALPMPSAPLALPKA